MTQKDIEDLEMQIKAERLRRELQALKFINQQASMNYVPSLQAAKTTSDIVGGFYREGEQ